MEIEISKIECWLNVFNFNYLSIRWYMHYTRWHFMCAIFIFNVNSFECEKCLSVWEVGVLICAVGLGCVWCCLLVCSLPLSSLVRTAVFGVVVELCEALVKQLFDHTLFQEWHGQLILLFNKHLQGGWETLLKWSLSCTQRTCLYVTFSTHFFVPVMWAMGGDQETKQGKPKNTA